MESTHTPAIKATAQPLQALEAIKDRLDLTYRVCCTLAPKQAVGEGLAALAAMPEWDSLRAALATPAIQAVAQQPAADEVPHAVWQERVACARLADSFAHEEGPGERRYSGNVISARILGRTKTRVADPVAAVPAQQPTDKCAGCNGHGMVGNILDSVECPFCLGSGRAAAPVAPDLASLFSHINEFPEINPANYGDDEVMAMNNWGIELVHMISPTQPDSHPVAQAPVEPSNELTSRDIRYLLDKHAEAAIDVHEHGDTGGFCVALASAEQAIFAAISHPVEPASALTDEQRTGFQWIADSLRNVGMIGHADRIIALLAASPKVEPQPAANGEKGGAA